MYWFAKITIIYKLFRLICLEFVRLGIDPSGQMSRITYHGRIIL